ncbi:glutaminase A [Roseisalinus antarcticus]|nr:glutaminase A [Roseisalinus antarcticus]
MPGRFPIPLLPSPITTYLDDLRHRLAAVSGGEVASYIPELGHADPAGLGICIATVDGAIYASGDTEAPFTIQSMSKPFTYGAALGRVGQAELSRRVGVEPTGEAFNSIILDEANNRPFNPMVNAGAIAVASQLTGPDDADQMLSLFSRLAGRPLSVDEAVFGSEKATGHRNRAIAYMMLNSGMIEGDPEAVLDLYFRQCSVTVTTSDMARMAACLANEGRSVTSGEEVYAPWVVRDVLTVMSTCGMYDYAGQWAYDVGIPAKSGVSGGIVAVIPGQAGIAIWSPPLDAVGNSVRGVEACKAISRDFGLHAFGQRAHRGTVLRSSRTGAEARSKRIRSRSEAGWLDTRGDRVLALELQGALYFGSAEAVIRHLSERGRTAAELVLDLSRLTQADAAGLRLMSDAIAAFGGAGQTITLAGIRADGPLSGLLSDAVRTAPDLDRALEAVEDRLLRSHQNGQDDARYALADFDLFAGLAPEEIRVLEDIVRMTSFRPGDRIVAEGEAADTVFMVASGAAEVSIALAAERRRRLASIGPGVSFGEMALVEGGVRTADVTALAPSLCYVFRVDELKALSDSHPRILSEILSNLVRTLAGRLGHANAEIRRLD